MSFLFHKRKTPQEAIKSINKYIAMVAEDRGANDPDLKKKIAAKLIENVDAIKYYLIVDGDEPKKELQDKMAELLLQDDSLVQILYYISSFDFESRKDLVSIFIALLRHYKEAVELYITEHQNVITILIEGYHDGPIALTCGAMLRELISRSEDITLLILQPTLVHQNNQFITQKPTQPAQPINGQLPCPHLDRLFGFVQLTVFDIAQDAFVTLKLLLTKHKKAVAKFLEANFHDFFTKYTQLLLLSDNYVTKRLGLKLLAEILLERTFFNVMIKWINMPEYLKIIMSLLRGNTAATQVDAYQVFKIFVANPRKSEAIQVILYRNKDKLIQFLQNFNDKGDEQFQEEKTILLSTLIHLEPPQQLQQQHQQQ